MTRLEMRRKLIKQISNRTTPGREVCQVVLTPTEEFSGPSG